MNENYSFLVRTFCATYNHESYISDALKGFVIQETSFPVVYTIVDDASTDKTVEVLKRFVNEHFNVSSDTDGYDKDTDYGHVTFAQHKTNKYCYFAVIYLKENHYSQKKSKAPYLTEWMDTKYVALCEGDDYWIDPLKLQKQVDFMEGHEEFAMCFTNCLVNNAGSVSYGNAFIWDTYTTEDMLLHNSLDMIKRGDHIVSPGHTSTILYKNPKEPCPCWISKCFIGDEPLFIALSKYGKAKFIDDATSVYREGVGVSSENFSFERDNCNRVQMYKLIDEGFNYKYHRLISSKIISRYYKKLTKIALNEKHYFKSMGYFLHSLWAKIV